jgi:hypothetical protein
VVHNSVLGDLSPGIPFRLEVASKWQEGIFGTKKQPGSGVPPRITDELRLKQDLMPFETRTGGLATSLGTAWLAKAIRYNPMIRDFGDPPGWYRALVESFLDWLNRPQGN